LLSRFPAQPIALAVEQSRGALVFMLGKYEHLHIYPIHPRAAAQFRAALYPSGAKDDPVDANLLLDLLVHHRGHLRRLSPDTEQTRLIQQLVEARRKLVNEKTRQSNRLTAQLKLYFPQILTWFNEVDSALVGALLERWPTLEALQKARQASLRSFFNQHNCRRAELIEQRLEQISQAIPAIRDAAVIQSAVATVSVLVPLIATLRQGIVALDRQIEQAAATHSRFCHLRFVPGSWSGTGTSVACCLRLAAGPLSICGRDTAVQRNCPRPGAQRKDGLGSLPLGLSEVPSPDVPGMGRAFHRLL
jgi:transposase